MTTTFTSGLTLLFGDLFGDLDVNNYSSVCYQYLSVSLPNINFGLSVASLKQHEVTLILFSFRLSLIIACSLGFFYLFFSSCLLLFKL